MYRRSSGSFGNLRCVYCVAVFLGLCFVLFGGVVCPFVWCGVLVLLWEWFVGWRLLFWSCCVQWCFESFLGYVLGLLCGLLLLSAFLVWCFRTVVGGVLWSDLWGWCLLWCGVCFVSLVG